MKKSKTFNLILIFLVVVAVIFLGYKFFVGSGDDGMITVTEDENGLREGEDQSVENNNEFADLLNELRGVKISETAVLDNATFNNLRDFSVQIPEVERGRPNPFAPVGGGGTTSVSPAPKKPAAKPALDPGEAGEDIIIEGAESEF